MKVEYEGRPRDTITLEDVPIGQCFMFPCGNTIYIKTEPEERSTFERFVSLMSGRMYSRTGEQPAVLVDAVLKVKAHGGV